MEFFRSVLSDLIAGLIGAGILAILVYLTHKVGPELGLRWANRLRRLGWPSLTSALFATALMSAIFRGATLQSIVALAVLFVVALSSVILIRFGPLKIQRLLIRTRAYLWPILSGIFFLSTVILLLVDGGRPYSDRVVFIVDLADEEMIVLRDILDTLEPRLGAKILVLPVDASRHAARLEKMAVANAVSWDLMATDIDMQGILAGRGLVEELSKYKEYEQLVPLALLPSLRPLKYEDGFYFVPFRPATKIAFYNEHKFQEYGLSAPKTWDELLQVARIFKEEEGVGRVAIQGSAGIPAAVMVFEFVKGAGGDPLALDDAGSRQAFAFLQQLKPYLASEYAETRFDTANELLIADQVYLVCNWTYGIKVVIEEAGKREIGVYSGWKGPEREVHVLRGDVLAIPKGAPHPHEAVKLMELLLSKETQVELASRLLWPPVRQDVYDMLPPELNQYFQVINDALSKAAVTPWAPRWKIIEKYLNQAFRELIQEGRDISSLEESAVSLRNMPSHYVPYRVEPGDTLEEIAHRCGTTVTILAVANDMTGKASVRPGQIVLVPQQQDPVAVD